MLIDKEERGEGDAYQDDQYEEYENETDEIDNNLSDMPVFGREASDPHAGHERLTKKAESIDEDEWEVVEIDPSPAD